MNCHPLIKFYVVCPVDTLVLHIDKAWRRKWKSQVYNLLMNVTHHRVRTLKKGRVAPQIRNVRRQVPRRHADSAHGQCSHLCKLTLKSLLATRSDFLLWIYCLVIVFSHYRQSVQCTIFTSITHLTNNVELEDAQHSVTWDTGQLLSQFV